MGKKRAREADGKAAARGERMEEDDGDEEDFDIVDVEFEWFNFDAEVDFHGTKTLLRQLLDVDASLFDMSPLADLILRQSTIGSTVKVDGKTNDAYALMTALSLREQRAEPVVAALTAYLAEKAQKAEKAPTDQQPPLAAVLPPLLAAQQQPQQQSAAAPGAAAAADAPHVGLVLAERLINMPAEVAPPMYSMLLDELEAAVEDGEPYAFTHFLILSKAYEEVASELPAMVIDGGDGDGDGDDDDDEEARRRTKKKKKARTTHGAIAASALSGSASPLYYFHVEDEVLRRHALASGTFAYTKDSEAVADSKRAFQDLGVQPRGLLMLIEASKMAGAVKAIGEYLKP